MNYFFDKIATFEMLRKSKKDKRHFLYTNNIILSKVSNSHMFRQKCIIVDDDELDRLLIQSFVKRYDLFELEAVFNDAESALEYLENNQVNIIFLDIEMPGTSGIDLRKKALQVPICVFISSHFENAAETFEIQTLDFIVKPVKFNRFEKCVLRIKEYLEINTKATLYEESIGGDSFYIKEGHEKVKIKIHEVIYLEALKNYTIITTETKKHYALKGFGEILKEKHFKNFIRIHRSYAVCKDKIEKISSQEVFLNNGISLPIGRNYKNLIS